MVPAGSRVLGLVMLALWLPAAAAAQRYDTALSFQTITTPHFWIHFHQGEDALARHVADMAEAVRVRLLAGRPGADPGRVHVILSGQDDVPNGWATTIPFNAIELRTVVPRPSSSIGHAADWLTLVFSHEYAHILHLDRSFGIMAATRRVFGRVPFAMPNLFLPAWQVEGIATWRESQVTGAGRVHDGSVRRVLAAAGRAGRFEPLDRVNGGLVTWPAGEAPYFYGGLFHDYLASRFGPESLDRLTEATARWPPYLGGFAYRGVFGASAGSLWRDFTREWTTAGDFPRRDTEPTQVTTDGFATASPRWDPARADVLFYARRTPHAFPSIVELDLTARSHRIVAEKYYGESLSVRGTRLVFDELRLDRNASLVSGLHVIDDHRVRTDSWSVASTERVGDADVAPDGQRVVAVVTRADRRELVTVGLTPGAMPVAVVSEPGTYFSGPRWSPDGRQIAVERVRGGESAAIVIVDASTGAVRALATRTGERQATPAWTPDGRTVVFAAASGDAPFNLMAADLANGESWAVTARPEGARAPDISPDGAQLAFLGYTTRGEDVFVMPFDRSAWAARPAPAPVLGAPVTSMARQAESSVAAPYSPWHGFVPRYWAPDVRTDDRGTAVGAFTSVGDVLGRHQADVSGVVWSDARGTDWSVNYAYQRFRPAVFIGTAAETERADDGILSSRTATVGVAIPFVTVRRSREVLAAIHLERLSLEAAEDTRRTANRHALRAGLWVDTTNSYGYSISAEEGIVAGLATEHVRPAFGADGRADWTSAELRYYRPIGASHAVLAARMAGARSSGDRGFRRRIVADDAGPARGVLSFDSDSVVFFRGAGASQVSGLRALGLNLDLRVPLWRVERGAGLYPVFLRWMHASAFVDAANAWDAGDSQTPRVALGLELSSDAVFGYALPLTITGGMSWRVDDGRRDARRVHGFVRVGRGF